MLLLIRHALVDACGSYLAGRTPGVHLNEHGRRQAAALADQLSGVPLAAVYTSPLERARETAAAIGRQQVPVCVSEDLNEVNFGQWTGLTFDELGSREDWRAFNRSRSRSMIPCGERMRDVQRRAYRALMCVYRQHPDANVALVSHGDVLRALVAYVIGTPLDRIDRFTIDPASVSVIEHGWRGLELTRLNCHAYSDYRGAAHG